MKSYKDRLRNRFKKQIEDIISGHKLQELVLVLDLTTAFILSNIFKLTQLIEMNINYIERLQKKRKKLNKHALYFITPSNQSVCSLSRDFQNPKQQPQYRRIHILFSSFIEKENLKIIATNTFLMKKIAKNSIKQFYCSMRVLAENMIDIGIPYLSYAFNKQESESQQIRRQKIADGMIQYIANCQEINSVRIYYKKSPNMVCQRMACELERAAKKYLGILVKNKSKNLQKSAKDITYLVLDRSIDPITPLLHYFTYEALLFDLFMVDFVGKAELKDQEAYSYEEIQNQSYERYRYRHISQALQKLPKALDYQKQKLDGLKSGGHQKLNIQQISERIADLRSNIDKLQMIWKKFQQLKLAELAQLQLSLATGLTSSGTNTSSSKLIDEVIDLIKKQEYSRDIKVRMALLCLCCIKLTKGDYMKLTDLFKEPQKSILVNINALGVTYDDSIPKSTKTITKQQQNIAKERMQRTGMELNRYTSILQLVVPLFLRVLTDPMESAKLDPQIFGQKLCTLFNDNNDDKYTKFDTKKFTIAMVGGMSWAEVSALRSIPELEDTVLITDKMYNPQEYLESLNKINIFQ